MNKKKSVPAFVIWHWDWHLFLTSSLIASYILWTSIAYSFHVIREQNEGPNRCLGNLQLWQTRFDIPHKGRKRKEFILPWKSRWKITSAIGMRRERTRQLGSHSIKLPLQKSTKYLEKTTAILHWREKTTCFFVIIVYFLLFLSRTSEKCDHECLAEAKNFFRQKHSTMIGFHCDQMLIDM